MTVDPISLHVGAVDAATAGRPLAGLDGPVSAGPDVESMAAAAGGGLAQRMQARLQAIHASNTRAFPVPGWDGDLSVTLRVLDSDAWARVTADGADISNADFVALATERVTVSDDGEEMTFPGWGGGFADLVGMPGEDPAFVVATVFGSNVVRLGGFVNDVVGWMTDGAVTVEDTLGK